jgi:hypothetical protein
MEEITKFKQIIEKNNIVLALAVPFRCHQVKYIEYQNMYGITKRLSFYNNSSNDKFTIDCKLKNNFYETSYIYFCIEKTLINSKGTNRQSDTQELFEGSCEETNEIFEALKKEFYDPHLIIPVPPMK